MRRSRIHKSLRVAIEHIAELNTIACIDWVGLASVNALWIVTWSVPKRIDVYV